MRLLQVYAASGSLGRKIKGPPRPLRQRRLGKAQKTHQRCDAHKEQTTAANHRKAEPSQEYRPDPVTDAATTEHTRCPKAANDST